jgi:hypothetical protein
VHNAAFPDPAHATEILNKNVTEWLLGTVKIPDDPLTSNGQTPTPFLRDICDVSLRPTTQSFRTRPPRTSGLKTMDRTLQRVTTSFHWKVRMMRSTLLLGGSTRKGSIMPLPFAAPMAIWALTRWLALIRYSTSIIALSTIPFQYGSGSGILQNVVT